MLTDLDIRGPWHAHLLCGFGRSHVAIQCASELGSHPWYCLHWSFFAHCEPYLVISSAGADERPCTQIEKSSQRPFVLIQVQHDHASYQWAYEEVDVWQSKPFLEVGQQVCSAALWEKQFGLFLGCQKQHVERVCFREGLNKMQSL